MALLKISLLSTIFFIPIDLNAGMTDFFGIGAIVTSVSETAWKMYAVRTFASMGPLILLIFGVIAVIFAANSAARLAENFGSCFKAALADNELSKTEKWILGIQGGFTAILSLVLLLTAFFVGKMVYESFSAIVKFENKPPIVAEENERKK